MKKCPNCGRETGEEQLFCPGCGHRMVAVPKQEVNKNEELLRASRQMQMNLQAKDSMIADLKRQLEEKSREEAGRKRKKKGALILRIAGALICVCSIAFALYCYFLAEEADSDYYDALYDKRTAEEELSQASDKAQFLDDYVAIIDYENDDGYYHTYDCSIWDWDGEWYITVYTWNGAESLGYEPCPECH